jgi:uncharacterized protein YgiM (DUF1202 family)
MKKLMTVLIMSVFMLSFGISAAAATKIYVNTDAYLRKGPGKDYSAYTCVDDGTLLTYLDEYDTDSRNVKWYKVSYEGRALWISSRCASQVGKPIYNGKKRVITKANCNLRKGPGLDYDAYASVQKGSSMKYLGSTKKDDRGIKWYKVSCYGRKLWVSSQVSYRKNSKTAKKIYVIDEEVNLREGPGLNYDIVDTVPEGTVLKYLNKSKKDNRKVKWYKISYQGDTAWISSKVCSLE